MTDFELAEETDEQHADDADEEERDPEEGEETDTEQESAESDETVVLAWVPGNEDAEMPLPDAIEANATMIEGNASEDVVEALESTVEGLQDDVADLREANENLRERLQTLESWRGGTVSTVNQNIKDINRLAAAVFDNAPPCPECDAGHLEADTGGWGDNTISCSECEYEEQMG